MTIGERIRKRRRELGLTQRELARRLDIRYATISDVERGIHKDVSSTLLRQLAKALGVTADYLIGMYDEDEDAEFAKMALVG